MPRRSRPRAGEEADILIHALIAASYVLASVGLAVAADAYASASALVIGPLVLAIGIAGHLGVAAVLRARVLEGRVRILNRDLRDALDDLDQMRAQVDGLHARIDDMPDAETLTSELKVLQGLLKQFSEKKEAAVRTEAIAAPKGGTPAGTPAGTSAGTSARAADSRGTSPIARPTSRVVALDGAGLLEAIETGLRDERVELYLQPIVSLPQRKRRFYECFSRIGADGDGVITPEQYIPVAEKAGLVAAIDNLLLVKCVQLVRRARRDHIDVQFFCNISNASLTDTDFFQEFIEFMAENAALAETLVFEFDQASVASEDYVTRMNLQRLRGYGYRFSLDQVGDLDLDLEDLASLGFRYIKVNSHLLHEMARGDDPMLDMRSFKGALDRNAMDLIVEKIESEDMLLDLLELRVDFGQGYLFGEPRPAGGRR